MPSTTPTPICTQVTFAAWNASWVGFKRPRHAAPRTGRAAELMGAQQGPGQGARGEEEEEDEEDEGPPALDLSVAHTVGFIATASCFLVLLFYVDLNKVIGIMYCISAGSAVANVAARPLLRRALLPHRLAQARLLDLPRWDVSITVLDFLSTALGLGMGVWWLLVRDTAGYAWVLQNLLGVALCVLFLTLVRFPNIKVATVLLVLAFVYDVFFVFLSPIFFHESVMIKVCRCGWVGVYGPLCTCIYAIDTSGLPSIAHNPTIYIQPNGHRSTHTRHTGTSLTMHTYTHNPPTPPKQVATGGEPQADETYCEKYPGDKLCQTREDLPMLLVLPRLGDYMGGFTMLGLGDIILPGLLVAFAARYDRATGVPLTRGFFRAMVLGYAAGLMMANMAVYLMQMGQPALLYLVPCTLGVFALMAHRRGLLLEMWKGPAVLAPPRRHHSSSSSATGGGGGNAEATAAVGASALPVAMPAGAAGVVLASPVEGTVAVDIAAVAGTQPSAPPAVAVGRGGPLPSVTDEDAPLLDL